MEQETKQVNSLTHDTTKMHHFFDRDVAVAVAEKYMSDNHDHADGLTYKIGTVQMEYGNQNNWMFVIAIYSLDKTWKNRTWKDFLGWLV